MKNELAVISIRDLVTVSGGHGPADPHQMVIGLNKIGGRIGTERWVAKLFGLRIIRAFGTH